MPKKIQISIYLFLFISGFSLFAQVDQNGERNEKQFKAESKPVKQNSNENEIPVIGDYLPDNNVYKNLNKTEKENESTPVSINLSLREKDIFKSQVVAKYFSPEKLKKINDNKPEKLFQIDFYFNKSFTYELIPEIKSEQTEVDDFIKNFDPSQYETQRKPVENTYIDFKEVGIRVILLAETELPFKIPEKFKNNEVGKGQCAGCNEGKRSIPKSTGEVKNQ